LSDRDFNKVYGLFYIGLKENMYYWEIIINNIRKIIIIGANIFLQGTDHENKLVVGIWIMSL